MTEDFVSAYLREHRVLCGVTVVSEQAAGLEVGLHTSNALETPTSLRQVQHAHVINREKPHCGPILWTHVGNGGSIRDGELGNAWAKEFDKFSHNANLTKVLWK